MQDSQFLAPVLIASLLWHASSIIQRPPPNPSTALGSVPTCCLSDFFLELFVFWFALMSLRTRCQNCPWTAQSQSKNAPGSHLGAPRGDLGAPNATKIKENEIGLSRPPLRTLFVTFSSNNLKETVFDLYLFRLSSVRYLSMSGLFELLVWFWNLCYGCLQMVGTLFFKKKTFLKMLDFKDPAGALFFCELWHTFLALLPWTFPLSF